MRPHRRQPTRLRRPWDSPGKNTGVGCHFLLQCMKVKSESEAAQSCPTPSDPMDCSLPGSSILGIFQASVLEWGAIAFSLYTCYLWQTLKSKFSLEILAIKREIGWRCTQICVPAATFAVNLKIKNQDVVFTWLHTKISTMWSAVSPANNTICRTAIKEQCC